MTPERAREWWTDKHATIPPIETIETHIIGGAIIPLWQRLKTNEQACLRVVRVTTQEGQRIVGIQIPPEGVGTVLRSLGLSRGLREPKEIFYAVLNEGEEMTLASNFKLRRGSIHSEPAVELCGADPYKFAELREFGLINEQINWKQRFFVPSDKTSGVEILTSLLDRYPVIAREDGVSEIESQVSERIPAPTIEGTNIVDLEQWIVAIEKGVSVNETANHISPRLHAEGSSKQGVVPEEGSETAIFSLEQEITSMPWLNQPVFETQLAFDFARRQAKVAVYHGKNGRR